MKTLKTKNIGKTSWSFQSPLSEQSTYLTTIGTLFRRYRFLRLRFGLVLSPETYKHVMGKMVSDLSGNQTFKPDQ